MARDNYKDYPQSIGELRAAKSSKAKDWTPRDALVDMLRQMDNGEIDVKELVIVAEFEVEEERITVYNNATSSVVKALGMLARAGHLMNLP